MALNKVQLIGNLGADPESRRLNNGDTVVNLRLATTDKWKDKSTGERKEKTEWHTIVIFNPNLVKIAEDYLKKGSKVYIEGKLQTRQWEKDGQKHYSIEVVLAAFNGTIELLDARSDGDGDRGDGRGRDDRDDRRRDDRDDRGSSSRGGGGRTTSRDLDDEIPFSPEFR